LSIQDGPQGYFNTSSGGAGFSIESNSVFGNGGNFFASVGGNVNTDWSVQSNGQNGGTVFIRGGGNTLVNGNIQANGIYADGGNVLLSTYGNLTLNGSVQAQGGPGGAGGIITLQSLKAAVTVTNGYSYAGVSLDASGLTAAGTVHVLASKGINISGHDIGA